MPFDQQEIFEKALAIEAETERQAYLKLACGEDVDLIRQIEGLLDSAQDAGSFMSKRAADSMKLTADVENLGAEGNTIGRYKLLEQIGEGGFGYVYMAEQTGPVVRKVALKVIKPGMDTKQVIARFEAERQALALMDHPNIGKILDAGATETGRPYFVMDLVRGIPITDYCEQRRLSTEERLELFTEVCGAIEHAHQKGIIHRDIKPTNILVYNNGDGAVPKVIDFGIAKATQGRLTDKTLFTQFHQFIGTPAYMSPEQAQMSGVDVDTRSDIYSLGVLLYELLTRMTPLDPTGLQQQGFEETCRRIRDHAVPKPSKRVSTLTHAELTTLASSQRTDATHVASRLRGDLDWIVMKALEKDRTRRYKTTDALVSDIQRHLNNEPVTAGPPSATYHFRKFLRRNRTTALTTLAFASVLLMGTVVSFVGWTQAVAAKRELANQVVTTKEALAESVASGNQARAERGRANLERTRAVKAAYLADIQAAHQALQLKNLGLARKLLQHARDLDPQLDLRHWEWRALWSQCRGSAETWFGGDQHVNSLSVHRDGKFVAAGGPNAIHVWDIFDGTKVHEFKINGIGKARFSPSGDDLLYTTDESGSVRAWHVPGFKAVDFLLSHEYPFHHDHEMEVAPDGTWLATFSGRISGKNGEVQIWDTRTQKSKIRIPSNNWQCPLAFSPDSSKLVLGGPPIRVIDLLESMDVTRPLNKDDEGWSGRADIVFSPDGNHIAIAMGNPEFMIRRVSDGERVARVLEHSHGTIGLAYSPDGTLLASASRDQTVVLWDTRSRRVVAELREHDLGVVHVAFTPDGQRLLSAGRDGKICVWNVIDVSMNNWPISKRGLYKWNAATPQVSCSRDGKMLATTHAQINEEARKPGVTLRSTKDLQDVETVAESSGIVRGVLYAPHDNLLVISNEQGALEFIDADETVKSKPVVFAAGRQAFPVQFTPDGKRLLVVVKETGKKHQDGETTCALYSVSDRRLITSWTIPAENCAAISPHGELIVTGHKDGLRFWPIEDLQNPTHVLVGGLRDGIGGLIWSVDFSPDGAYVVGGANLTGRIEIVDVKSKRPAGYLAGHVQHIGAVRFSPDGKRLASGGHTFSDALKLWDFESRREIMSLSVDGAWSAGQIEWLDDNSIMLLTGDSLVCIWRVPSFEEIQEQERMQEIGEPQR